MLWKTKAFKATIFSRSLDYMIEHRYYTDRRFSIPIIWQNDEILVTWFSGMVLPGQAHFISLIQSENKPNFSIKSDCKHNTCGYFWLIRKTEDQWAKNSSPNNWTGIPSYFPVCSPILIRNQSASWQVYV